VHLKNGPWVSNGGYEYNLVLIVAVAALVETGPGCLSLDAARGSQRRGALWALAALAAGAAGSVAALELAKREAAADPLPATA
jgi:putative oxidoreductase